MRARGLSGIGFAVCAAAFAAFGAHWLQNQDLDAVPDGDLAFSRYPLPPEENGFHSLRRAVGLLALSDRQSRQLVTDSQKRSWKPEQIRTLLERNADALQALDLTLGAPVFQVPDDMPPAEVLAWQKLTKLLIARAALAASEGKFWTAADDWQRILALSARIERAWGTSLLTAQVGFAMRERALDAINLYLERRMLSGAVSKALARILPTYRSEPKSWSQVWPVEYQRISKALATSAENTAFALDAHLGVPPLPLRLAPESYLFQLHRTQARFADFFRRRVREAGLPCSEKTEPVVPEVDLEAPWQGVAIADASNCTGALLFRMAVNYYREAEPTRCTADTRVVETAVLLALHAYESTREELPKNLQQLVPTYLAAVPLDPFDGKELRYVPEQRYVYSVGNNFTDEGGRPGARWDLSEPTLQLAEATP